MLRPRFAAATAVGVLAAAGATTAFGATIASTSWHGVSEGGGSTSSELLSSVNGPNVSVPVNEFDGPSAIASDGTHVWVANSGNGGPNGTVTELSASTGALVKVVSGPGYKFHGAFAIASDGKYVWVANSLNNTVTELSASTGALVTVLSGSSYKFDQPVAIASDGKHVWVANCGRGCRRGTVTELSASTGALVRVLSGPSYEFQFADGNPGVIASDGRHVWVVTDAGGHAVTELSASTGALVKVVSSATLVHAAWSVNEGFSPVAIASDGRHVWVTDGGLDGFAHRGAVVELSASTGALVEVLSGSSYKFDAPGEIASDGKHVWVANGNTDNTGNSTVTELSASTGAAVRVLSGPSYDFTGAPDAIASDGKHVWVAEPGNNTVTEVSDSTGSLVTVLNGMSYSTVSAGYSEAAPNYSDVFNAVSVKWTVPTLTCPPGASTIATWGPEISGDKGEVADGTQESCAASGTPNYFAWCELGAYRSPGPECDVPYPVSPGDAIAAAVTISGATSKLSMADTTKGWTWSSTYPNSPLPGANELANVFVQNFGPGLADFGAVDFTGATAELDGKTHPLRAVDPSQAFWMINGSTLLAAPGPLDPEGDFTVTWYAN